MSIYGLILGFSLAVGVDYFYSHNKTIPKIKENFFIFSLILSGIIGARAYGVIADWNYFYQNPIQILNLRGGGLGIIGALIFSLIFIYFFAQKFNLHFLKIALKLYQNKLW